MISADGMDRAACSANRIISTAPIAKFGATSTFGAASRVRSRSSSRSPDEIPVVPTTRCTPCSMPHRIVSMTTSGRVKSTATSASASSRAVEIARDRQPFDGPSDVVRVDRGHQVQIGIGGDGAGDLAPHPSRGPDHADADHAVASSPGSGSGSPPDTSRNADWRTVPAR